MLFESLDASPRASYEQICLSPGTGENSTFNPSTRLFGNLQKEDLVNLATAIQPATNSCGSASPASLPPLHRGSTDIDQGLNIDELLCDGLRRSSISTPSHSNGSTTSTASTTSTSTTNSTSSTTRCPGSRRVSSDSTAMFLTHLAEPYSPLSTNMTPGTNILDVLLGSAQHQNLGCDLFSQLSTETTSMKSENTNGKVDTSPDTTPVTSDTSTNDDCLLDCDIPVTPLTPRTLAVLTSFNNPTSLNNTAVLMHHIQTPEMPIRYSTTGSNRRGSGEGAMPAPNNKRQRRRSPASTALAAAVGPARYGAETMHLAPVPAAVSRSGSSTGVGSSSSASGAGAHMPGVLNMHEQPTDRGRFRYAKEKRRTPLPGRTERSWPTVALSDDWEHRIPTGTTVTASVVTRHDDHLGIPVPHWHHFEGSTVSDDGFTGDTSHIVEGKAVFPNLVVIRGDRGMCAAAAVLTKPAEEQLVIRIRFDMSFRDAQTGIMVNTWVVSDPIYSHELKIADVSHQHIRADSATEVIILTSKIKKNNMLLRITDPTPGAWLPGDKTDPVPLPTRCLNATSTATTHTALTSGGMRQSPAAEDRAVGDVPEKADGSWHLDSRRRPTCLLTPTRVHYQCSLVVTLPPYWNAQIRDPHRVEVRLVDFTQGLESNPIGISYMPNGQSQVENVQ
eukprot:m.454021 g.454021  ORF g.454021 m.454021 type:complete len:673 (+) comp21562_c0_seq1:100-2118(+)